MENGKFFKDKIPGWFLDKMTRTGIINPFYSAELAERMKMKEKAFFMEIMMLKIRQR